MKATPPLGTPGRPTHPKYLGRYELRQVLGKGAHATVWLAHDPRLDRLVAIKVMQAVQPGSGAAMEPWLREARHVARLSHPHIATLFEADVIDGGTGDDLIFGDTGSAPSRIGDLSGADIIAGGEGNDTMYGGGGDDLIDGAEGNDVIYGGAGLDGMTGGFGDDLFVMDASDTGVGNAMDGGLGFDTVDYSASNGQVLVLNGPVVGVNVNMSVANVAAAIPGDALADVEAMIGTRFNDTLVGGALIINVYQTDPLTGAFILSNGVRVLPGRYPSNPSWEAFLPTTSMSSNKTHLTRVAGRFIA